MALNGKYLSIAKGDNAIRLDLDSLEHEMIKRTFGKSAVESDATYTGASKELAYKLYFNNISFAKHRHRNEASSVNSADFYVFAGDASENR